MDKSKIIVKHVPGSRSPYNREQRPVRTYNPNSKQMEETGQVSGRRKPNGVYETLRFNPDREAGKFVTGLEQSTANPFKGMTPLDLRGRYNLPASWTEELLAEIVDSDKLTLQRLYEIMDGVEYNYYTPIMAPSMRNSRLPIRNKDTDDKTFIETFEIILYEGANVFTKDTSRGRMAIQMVQHSSLVAPSLRDVNKDIHGWYIAEEFEAEKSRVEIDDAENRAVVALMDLFENFPTVRPYQLGVNLDLFRGHLSPSAVKDQLNRYVKAKLPNDKRSEKVERLNRFMREYAFLKDNFPTFICRFLVFSSKNVGVTYVDGGKLYWRTKRDTPTQFIWRNEEQLIGALQESMDSYNPDKELQDNMFADMVQDLRDRGQEIVITG